ncbi:hypothetical protein Tco_0971891 [Tanacetum coccineum]
MYPVGGNFMGLEYGRYGVSKVLDMTYQGFLRAQIRRIFVDGYGVLDVRTIIFKISSFKLQNAFLSDHVIKTLATNPDIPVRAIQDQMHKQFDVGLIQAIASVFPSAEHKFCVKHIHENMKSQFKGGVYKDML